MKSKISNLEIGSLNYFITRAFLISVTFNAIIKSTKLDSWIIPLINIILGIIYIYFLNRIINYKPNISINKKITKMYNKKISIVIVFSCILFASFLGIVNFLNLGNFVQSQFLTKTPLIVILLAFGLASIYCLSKEIHTISRVSVILLYMSIFLFIISFIGLIPSFNISNIKPLFQSSTSNYINSLVNFYAFNISPLFILACIPKNNINNPKIKKTLSISFILSSITLFIMIISTLGVFGYNLTLLYEYPEYHVLKSVSIFGLTSRIESILVMQIIFDMFITHIIIIYYIGDAIKSIFNIKKINLFYFLILILFIIGCILFSKYNMILDNILINGIPYISTIFSFITMFLLNIKISKN